MKAAFLSGSLISSKGMAEPASRAEPPKDLIARRTTPNQTPVSAKPAIDVERKTDTVLRRVSVRPVSEVYGQENDQQKPAEIAKIAEQSRPLLRRKPVASSVNVYKTEQKKLKKDGLGRVRMSIRLDPDDHLTLKLLAAHSRKSSQVILEEALREYTINHAETILPQSCHCLPKPLKI